MSNQKVFINKLCKLNIELVIPDWNMSESQCKIHVHIVWYVVVMEENNIANYFKEIIK